MAEVVSHQTLIRGSPSFFVWMAGYCAIVAFGGFSISYFVPMALGQLEALRPAVHIHGFLFSAWMVLFVAQSLLVGSGRIALHRNVGMAGISLATAMIIFGLLVNLLSNGHRIEVGELDRAYSLGFGGWMALLAFGTLFGMAIRNVNQPERHRRWMLFATAMLLQPATGRLFRPFNDSWGMFLGYPTTFWAGWCTVNVVLVACLVYDWRTLRRPHPVTLICAAVLIAREVLPGVLSGSATWRTLYDMLLSLVA